MQEGIINRKCKNLAPGPIEGIPSLHQCWQVLEFQQVQVRFQSFWIEVSSFFGTIIAKESVFFKIELKLEVGVLSCFPNVPVL
jgi:hypothetical protein